MKKKKEILLVEPKRSVVYHTAYPPLGLLKIAAFHQNMRDKVNFVQGKVDIGLNPDIIYITSLFTYAWEPVHDLIEFYINRYKKARVMVGGIYATLCFEHIQEKFGDRVKIHKGLLDKVENIMPDYSMVPDWDASIIFSSRGCVRRCKFCSVPILEPEFHAHRSIKKFVYPGHKRIIFWDNNFLASPYREDILDELEELNLTVDFNQGLDARYIDEKVALRIKKLRMPLLRLAYDSSAIRDPLKRAIEILKSVGISGRDILVYSLFNFMDDPESFLEKIRDLMEWEVVCYPMRYTPLKPIPKNSYVALGWTAEQIDMLQKARRVIGIGGAFPPYLGLKKKIFSAKNFEEAFSLRPATRVN